MKRFLVASALALAAITTIGAIAYAAGDKGNGAPSGAHYNLNIIGVQKEKMNNVNLDPNADPNGGKRIFVGLGKDGVTASTKIMLSPSPDATTFNVLDYNGTDGQASFQLPLPGECYATLDEETGDIVTPASCTVRYTVWIRALGKPTGSADMGTCIEDPDLPGGYMCSDPAYWVDVTRKAGNVFTNVSGKLLFMSNDVDGDSKIEHVQLFDPMFDDYYWQYDNQGLKLAQLRFYMGAYKITW